MVLVVLCAFVGAPLVLDAVLFAYYAMQFHGVCNAHAMDIPARACTYAEYLGDCLGSAFGVIAIVMIDGIAAVVVGGAVGAMAVVVWMQGRGAGRRG